MSSNEQSLEGLGEIAAAAEHAADAVGVTKYSGSRPWVVQAVKYALEQTALRQPDTRMEGGGDDDKWRDLALQFDGHRIEALSILRGILAHNTVKHDCGAREFLTKPPLPGEAVLAKRIEALAAPSSPTVGELEVVGWRWRNHGEDWRYGPDRPADGCVGSYAFGWAQEPLVTLSSAQSSIQRAERERDEARALADRLKLEAQGHASEAKTANSTIYEIYQVLSGSKGEPGNWNGAEPARKFVAQLEEARKVLEAAKAFVHHRYEPAIDSEYGLMVQIDAFLASLREKQDAE